MCIRDRASAVSNDLSTLDRTTSEYAAWDQTYEYVQGKRPTYEKTEFPAPTFQQLQISFVAIYDLSGKRLFAKGFDLDHGGEYPLPEGLEKHLVPGSQLLTHGSVNSRIAEMCIRDRSPAVHSKMLDFKRRSLRKEQRKS